MWFEYGMGNRMVNLDLVVGIDVSVHEEYLVFHIIDGESIRMYFDDPGDLAETYNRIKDKLMGEKKCQ